MHIARRLILFSAIATAPGCDRAGAGSVPADDPATALGATDPACGEDSVRPATGAPAEGVWLHEGPGTPRVAAIVGPTQTVAGQARVTRRVETVETGPGADTIRFASDTASVRLEFVSPAARPAAAYAVGPLVLLASYEPCASGLRKPLIRYLRQDTAGAIATDVMLARTSDSP